MYGHARPPTHYQERAGEPPRSPVAQASLIAEQESEGELVAYPPAPLFTGSLSASQSKRRRGTGWRPKHHPPREAGQVVRPHLLHCFSLCLPIPTPQQVGGVRMVVVDVQGPRKKFPRAHSGSCQPWQKPLQTSGGSSSVGKLQKFSDGSKLGFCPI